MKAPKHILVLISTLIFVILFYEKSLGLNVALFSILTLGGLALFKKEFWNNTLNGAVAAGFLLTSIFYFMYGSPFALAVAIGSFLLLFGLHSSVKMKSLWFAIPNSFSNYRAAIGHYLSAYKLRKKTRLSINFGRLFRIAFLPFFIILFFLAIYSLGSSYFAEIIGKFGTYFNIVLTKIGEYIEFKVILVVLIGLLISVIHALKLTKTAYSDLDNESSDFLSRIRRKVHFKFRLMDLKMEYKSGVFLFSVLNLMLLLLVVLEIKNVWFGFEWQGEYLKSMVHTGTYILIVSILVSIGVTMYYFRRNINFLKSNQTLKYLAYVWIALNCLLVISVFVRNHYYIQHFALAHLRIGVMFFLGLCFVGLVTLFFKVKDVRSNYFLFRTNALAAYIGLVAICAFNWDVIIAKYNFNHYKTAFLHLPFMSSLSDKALPYLQISEEQIEEIESKQVEKIPFVRKRGYFKEVDYKNKIDSRIDAFIARYESEHWLEHVWAEKKAYELLKDRS